MSTTTSRRPVLSSDELATVLRRARDEQWQELALMGEGAARYAYYQPLSSWVPERVVLVTSLPAERLGEFVTLDSLRTLVLLGIGVGDEEAKALTSLTGLTSLDLGYNRLGNEGAKALASLTHLTSLDLGGNQIGAEGAKALASLTRLTSLGLGRNLIGGEGAKALASLPHLTSLKLLHSRIGDEGAKALASLTRLTSLDLGYNELGDEGTKALASLTRLTSLNLRGNQIGAEGAKALASLTRLTSLNLRGNQIGAEGAKALASLTRLTSLYLGGNELGDEGAKALASLTHLTSLDLTRNALGDEGVKAFVSLPNLRKLGLSDNHIQRVRSLVAIPSLTELRLLGNPLVDAPHELLGETPEHNCLPALRAYYQDLTRGAVPNRVVKVLLVGNGCVGKTTLAHCLAKGSPPAKPVVERTHGIELQTFDLTLSADESIEVRLWDFGGQERYHATHRLFVQASAFYLLLWAEETDEMPEEMCHPAGYWLELIHTLSPNANVLLVKNQIDRSNKRGRPIDLEGHDFGAMNELGVSAATYRNLNVLRAALVDLVQSARERWYYQIPKSWQKVRKTLVAWRQAGDDGRPMRQLSRGRFEQLCSLYRIEKPGEVLKFLHETGEVFHRPGRFDGSIILDLNWFINAIYRLFDRRGGVYERASRQHQGTLTGAVFKTFWQGEEAAHCETYFDFLLQTGMAFELMPNHAKPFAERTLVVPALLPAADDERLSHVLDSWGDPVPGEIWVRFDYPFLHRGQVEQIIVALSELSVGRSWWRDGLVVKDPETGCLLQLQASREPASSSAMPRVYFLELRLRKGRQLETFARVRKVLDRSLGRPPTRTLVSNDGTTFVDLAKLYEARHEGAPQVVTTRDRAVARERFDRFAPFTHAPEPEQDLLPEKPTAKATRIFISYAQEDQSHRDALVKQLVVLKRQVAIDFWHNGQLLAGTEVADEIGKQLNAADVTLLLISTDFINSGQCFSSEMAKALEKYDEKRGVVVPIVVRPTTGWQDLLIGRHRALPSNQEPISRWADKDEAWADVSAGLLKLLKQRGASPR
jgi:internalin A